MGRARRNGREMKGISESLRKPKENGPKKNHIIVGGKAYLSTPGPQKGLIALITVVVEVVRGE